jgi:hypothetical protein
LVRNIWISMDPLGFPPSLFSHMLPAIILLRHCVSAAY